MKTLVLLTSLLSTVLSWIQRDEDVSSTYFLIIDHAFMDSKG